MALDEVAVALASMTISSIQGALAEQARDPKNITKGACYPTGQDFSVGVMQWTYATLEKVLQEQETDRAEGSKPVLYWLSMIDLAREVADLVSSHGQWNVDFFSDESYRNEWLNNHPGSMIPAVPNPVPRPHRAHSQARLAREKHLLDNPEDCLPREPFPRITFREIARSANVHSDCKHPPSDTTASREPPRTRITRKKEVASPSPDELEAPEWTQMASDDSSDAESDAESESDWESVFSDGSDVEVEGSASDSKNRNAAVDRPVVTAASASGQSDIVYDLSTAPNTGASQQPSDLSPLAEAHRLRAQAETLLAEAAEAAETARRLLAAADAIVKPEPDSPDATDEVSANANAVAQMQGDAADTAKSFSAHGSRPDVTLQGAAPGRSTPPDQVSHEQTAPVATPSRRVTFAEGTPDLTHGRVSGHPSTASSSPSVAEVEDVVEERESRIRLLNGNDDDDDVRDDAEIEADGRAMTGKQSTRFDEKDRLAVRLKTRRSMELTAPERTRARWMRAQRERVIEELQKRLMTSMCRHAEGRFICGK